MNSKSTTETPDPLPPSSDAHTESSRDNPDPPSPDQKVTELVTGPGDSVPLSKIHEDLLNDGIADQASRREQRRPIVRAALAVLAVFTLVLLGIASTLGYAFYKASEPNNIAKFAALELKGKIDQATTIRTDKLSTSTELEKAPNTGVKPSNEKNTGERETPKENEPIKIEAKIYGEIRDSMVPLVAVVSILAIAIVVILGTMLKAAFAPHPNNSSDLKEKEEISPVPVLEAIKALVESVKAALK